MRTAAQAEASLHKHARRYGCSEDGIKWMDYAIDPFKDTVQPRPTGFPDEVTTPSVVQEVHQRIVASAPASAAGGNWDANIFFDGTLTSEACYTTTISAGQPVFAGQGATPYRRGGLQIRSAAAGTALDQTTQTSYLDLDNSPAGNGRFRVLAMGMEVHNESPPTVKSGSVIVWRNPVPSFRKPTTILGDTTGAAAFVSQVVNTYVAADPPYTASLAVDMQGSETWEAEAGAYIVPVLKDAENPPVELSAMAIQGYDTNTSTYYEPLIVKTGTYLLTMPTANITNSVVPFSQSGAYFTNLNNATSLVVDLIWYVEIFPTITSILRRSAVPSCEMDTKSIELYSAVMSKIPAGVPVDENFLGAFIAGAARLASAVVPTIVRAASGAARIANGINAAAEVVSTVANAIQPRERHPSEYIPQPEQQRAIVEYVPETRRIMEAPVRETFVAKPQRRQLEVLQPQIFYPKRKRNPNKGKQQQLAASLMKQRTANKWVETQPELTIQSKRKM